MKIALILNWDVKKQLGYININGKKLDNLTYDEFNLFKESFNLYDQYLECKKDFEEIIESLED